jgi:Ca2+-binding EF-hand superfamily protein
MKKLLITGLLLAASSIAFAENEKFSVLDVDKDGLISLEEAKFDKALTEAFAKLDLNQDGYLSALEMTVKLD